MRKFIISAALAASTLVAAAPAAAQWYPPQGNAYGYNNYGQARRLQARVDLLQRHIINLDRQNVLSNREAGRLRGEARGLENRLQRSARNGLNNREAYDIERGIQRLEVRVQREARDGNRYGGYYNQTSWSDRDRDGLDDRYERDHGRDYDEDHDRD